MRFTTNRTDPGAQAGTTAILGCGRQIPFSGAAMRAEDRMINPLGFQVIRYRRDAETSARAITGAGQWAGSHRASTNADKHFTNSAGARSVRTAFAALLLILAHAAQASAMQSDDRVETIPYPNGEVVPLRSAAGGGVMIILAPGEQVLGFDIVDPEFDEHRRMGKPGKPVRQNGSRPE